MTRLIDADALLEEFREHLPYALKLLKDNGQRHAAYFVQGYGEDAINLITNAPTVQREGWVSVPIEPTEEMIRQGLAVEFPGTYKKYLRCPFNGTKTKIENEAQISRMTKQYKAMLQAAPTYKE